jgi:hypothetical protein
MRRKVVQAVFAKYHGWFETFFMHFSGFGARAAKSADTLHLIGPASDPPILRNLPNQPRLGSEMPIRPSKMPLISCIQL